MIKKWPVAQRDYIGKDPRFCCCRLHWFRHPPCPTPSAVVARICAHSYICQCFLLAVQLVATLKKRKLNFPRIQYKEIKKGAVAKKPFLIQYITLQPLPSKFLVHEENFLFFFISVFQLMSNERGGGCCNQFQRRGHQQSKEPEFVKIKEPKNRFHGLQRIDSASLCSLAARYDKKVINKTIILITVVRGRKRRNRSRKMNIATR